jgi:hypothetical protein
MGSCKNLAIEEVNAALSFRMYMQKTHELQTTTHDFKLSPLNEIVRTGVCQARSNCV